jgi:hypothetical protein
MRDFTSHRSFLIVPLKHETYELRNMSKGFSFIVYRSAIQWGEKKVSVPIQLPIQARDYLRARDYQSDNQRICLGRVDKFLGVYVLPM